MSQNDKTDWPYDVDPAEMQTGNDPETFKPVGTQAHSAGQMHENAMNAVPFDNGYATSKPVPAQQPFVPTAWSNGNDELLFKSTCPSGQVILLKRPGILDIANAKTPAGSELSDEMDFFSKALFVEDDGQDASIYSVLKDPKKRFRLFNLLDAVLLLCVKKPTIKAVPLKVYARDNEEALAEIERTPIDSNIIWAHKIDFNDKMHIFNEINQPMEQIRSFRVESESGVERMAAIQESFL